MIQYVLPLLKPKPLPPPRFPLSDDGNIGNNHALMFLVLSLLEVIIISAILTIRISPKSSLVSSQIGTLIQYYLLATFYLSMGRFDDIHAPHKRDTSNDWIIYLGLMIAFMTIYIGIANFEGIRRRCGKKRA